MPALGLRPFDKELCSDLCDQHDPYRHTPREANALAENCIDCEFGEAQSKKFSLGFEKLCAWTGKSPTSIRFAQTCAPPRSCQLRLHCGRCAEPTPSTVQKNPRKCDRTCRDNSAEPALRERLLENVTEVVAGMAHNDASPVSAD